MMYDPLIHIPKYLIHDPVNDNSVCLADRLMTVKRQLDHLTNLYKLKNLEEKFKNLSIAHDMTKQERNCKDLVEEAKKNNPLRIQRETTYTEQGGAPGAMQIVRLRKMH